MKINRLIGILLIGCAVQQLFAGSPATTISEEIADTTAASVSRRVAAEAGEIAEEAAKAAKAPRFVYHMHTNEVPSPPISQRTTSEPVPQVPPKPVLQQTVSAPPQRPSTFGTLAPPQSSPALGATTIPGETGLASGLPKGFTKRASYIKTSERGFNMVPGKSKRLTVETPQHRESISGGQGQGAAHLIQHRGSVSISPHPTP